VYSLFTDKIRDDQEAQTRVLTLCEKLESGEYTQAYGALRTRNGYCCLGVMCNEYDGLRWEYNECFYIYDHENPCEALLNSLVMEAFCIRTPFGDLSADSIVKYDVWSLTNMNDSRNSFETIAQCIREELAMSLDSEA
jgi:hypothetical protein